MTIITVVLVHWALINRLNIKLYLIAGSVQVYGTHDVGTSTVYFYEMTLTPTQQEYWYNNNGKPNPDNIVLYLYSTYNSNSFHPISIISYTMILVHHREFQNLYGIDIAPVVKL